MFPGYFVTFIINSLVLNNFFCVLVEKLASEIFEVFRNVLNFKLTS
jgi:hypothetical protein